MLFIHNSTIITPQSIIEHGALLVNDAAIYAVGNEDELRMPPGAMSIDAGGSTLVSGFIELQINGLMGYDFTSEPESIWRAGEYLTHFGVTSFLPTIVSSPLECIANAQAVLRKGPPEGYQGARVLGLHLEGPYLNPEKCGAHNPGYLRLPDSETYKHWRPANFIRVVTLAPELPGAIPAIKSLVRQGVLVSAGHSMADANQAQTGFKAGIRYGTHLFNAMPALNHRHPGLAEALLGDGNLCMGLIVDGIHVDPLVVSLAWKILGYKRTNLVTDAVAPMGMPAGEYHLGDQVVYVDGSSARLADGHLAGSLLSLDKALRNLVAFTGCSLAEAVSTVSQVPSRLLGLATSIGSIAPGNKADLVLLSPDQHVVAVWVDGKQVFPYTHNQPLTD
jgi:N-acetylglucosamine-6-phosphate deacetylase